MTTTAPIVITELTDLIDRNRGITSEDLHSWADDIDWSDYTPGEMAESAGEIGELLARAADHTGQSAADVVAQIEHALGW